jgi:hypothetical protein
MPAKKKVTPLETQSQLPDRKIGPIIGSLPKRYKFARVASWLFIALFVLTLIYIYFRAKDASILTLHDFVNHTLLKYSLISLAGVIFWGVVLRLKDEIKLNFVMIFSSLMVVCYLVEIALAFLFPIISGQESPLSKRGLQISSKNQVEYDTRDKLEVWRDLKSKGVDALPWIPLAGIFSKTNGIPGADSSLFPLSQVSKKTIVYCNESGVYATWLSDRYGLRNPDSEWDASQTAWALTGDSFSLGACVMDGEDVSGQIRLLSGERVLNIAPGGLSMLTQLGSLKEYAVFKKPKIVLWLFYEGNDLQDLKEEAKAPTLMNYLQPEFSQRLIYRQTEINKELNEYFLRKKVKFEKSEADVYEEMHWKPKIPQGFSMFIINTRILRLFNIRRRLGTDTASRITEVKPLFFEILTKARNRVAAWGGKLYFVYLPEYSRYQSHMKYSGIDKRDSNVVNAVKSLNIPIIHIHKESFSNHPDPLSLFPFRNAGHYNAKGYNEVAKAIILRIGGKE